MIILTADIEPFLGAYLVVSIIIAVAGRVEFLARFFECRGVFLRCGLTILLRLSTAFYIGLMQLMNISVFLGNYLLLKLFMLITRYVAVRPWACDAISC
jgi:hypothetical protein